MKQLGKYVLQEKIGQGGMGTVYKAWDSEIKRPVALKVLTSQEDSSTLKRFLREVKTTASLQHPNIITLYDTNSIQNIHFFTMDYINGKSLEHYTKNQELSTRRIVEIVYKVALALEYAHSKGVIHRDLKPDNIMLSEEKEPILMDFGLAKTDKNSQKLSQSGMIIGTVLYMAPEQVRGSKKVDKQSDVYGLGAVLYAMLVGQPPFLANTFTEVVEQILHRDPQFPSTIRQRTPLELDAICHKAMAKDKRDRYASAQEFAEDLRKHLAGEVISISRSNLPKRLLRKFQLHRAICSMGVLCFFLVLVIIHQQNQYHLDYVKWQQRYTQAKNLAEKEQQLTPKIKQNLYETKIRHANFLEDSGHFKEAITEYTEAGKMQPSNDDFYYRRGATFLAMGKLESAMQDLEEATKLNPSHFRAYMRLADIFAKQGNWKQAELHYDKSITIKSDYFRIYYKRSQLWITQHKWEKALIDINQAIKLDSSYLNNYVRKAIILGNTGDTTEAIRYLTKVISKEGASPSNCLNRSILFIRENKFHLAKRDLEFILWVEPLGPFADKARALLQDIANLEKY